MTTTTINHNAFYLHPHPRIAKQQERARTRAVIAIRSGWIRWSNKIGVSGGFGQITAAGQLVGVGIQDALALHELRHARLITVNTATGHVALASERAAA